MTGFSLPEETGSAIFDAAAAAQHGEKVKTGLNRGTGQQLDWLSWRQPHLLSCLRPYRLRTVFNPLHSQPGAT